MMKSYKPATAHSNNNKHRLCLFPESPISRTRPRKVGTSACTKSNSSPVTPKAENRSSLPEDNSREQRQQQLHHHHDHHSATGTETTMHQPLSNDAASSTTTTNNNKNSCNKNVRDQSSLTVLSPGAQTIINHCGLIAELLESSSSSKAEFDPHQVDYAKRLLAIQIGTVLTTSSSTGRFKILQEIKPLFTASKISEFEEIGRVSEIGYLFRLKIENTARNPRLRTKRERMERNLEELRRTIGNSVAESMQIGNAVSS